ncbi:MAG TPA: hypothetical protein VFS72_09430 [Agromyces sp.]|nr:hypothetical protein [Agromyces sp.]
MDPNTARGVLRLDPAEPLTLHSVDDAYQRELWTRHPSRYPDTEGRAAAEAWRVTLGSAHAALVAEVMRPAPPTAAVGAPRRRLSGGAIAAIVVAGVVAAALFVAVGVGVFSLVRDGAEAVIQQADGYADESGGASGDQAVERYEAGETLYAFPSALEVYWDGRYSAECPAEHELGCWEMALFTESDCRALQVTLGYSAEETAVEPDATELLTIEGVTGDAATPVVFGNDQYPYGWINEVVCLDEPTA